MEKNELSEFMDRVKKLEEMISDDLSDSTNFINEYNEIMSMLNEKTVEDVIHKKLNATFSFPEVDVKIKKLHPDAVIPSYSNDGDAGMDLVATQQIENIEDQVTYGTGLAMEIPYGYVGLIFPRSSIRNYGLTLSNSVGVIDSTYRGELRVVFNKSFGFNSLKYKVGDRIAQIIILPYPKINFVLSDELSETKRGIGGFGSTGL